MSAASVYTDGKALEDLGKLIICKNLKHSRMQEGFMA